MLFSMLALFTPYFNTPPTHPILQVNPPLQIHQTVTSIPSLSQAKSINPRNEANHLVGGYNYVVDGRIYHVIKPKHASTYKATGVASWYGKDRPNQLTASGAKFKGTTMDAASKILPLGTRVEVTDLQNGNSIVVTINDRGPFVHGRIIDLTYTAAKNLGYVHQGTAPVKVIVIFPPAPHVIKQSY